MTSTIRFVGLEVCAVGRWALWALPGNACHTLVLHDDVCDYWFW